MNKADCLIHQSFSGAAQHYSKCYQGFWNQAWRRTESESDICTISVCVWQGWFCHVPMVKFCNESGRNWQQNKVIHGSWRLISIRSPHCASVLSIDAHMCCDVQGISMYSKRRENPPRITHTQMKAQFTNTSCRHTFIFFWRLICHVLIHIQVHSSRISAWCAIYVAVLPLLPPNNLYF